MSNPAAELVRRREKYRLNAEHHRQKTRDYRAKNPEKAREATRRWRERNRATILETRRKWYAAHRDEVLSRLRSQAPVRYRENLPAMLLENAQRRAKRAGLPFELSVADVVIPDACPVLGIPLVVGNKRRHDNSPTIDRVVPEKGYVPGNVAVISWRANRIKNNGTAEEHRRIAAYIESFQKSLDAAVTGVTE